MKRKYIVANSILWATAIIASAALGAPTTLSLVLLPSLASISWLTALPRSSSRGCSAQAPTAL